MNKKQRGSAGRPVRRLSGFGADRFRDSATALPRPLIIPGVMIIATLADVRTLIVRHLPAEYRAQPAWRHAATELAKAAAGTDTADVSIALRLALALSGVEFRMK